MPCSLDRPIPRYQRIKVNFLGLSTSFHVLVEQRPVHEAVIGPGGITTKTNVKNTLTQGHNLEHGALFFPQTLDHLADTPNATAPRAGADTAFQSVSHKGVMGGPDECPLQTEVPHIETEYLSEEGQQTAESGEASGADERTDWETEQEAFFSAQHQSARTFHGPVCCLGWWLCH